MIVTSLPPGMIKPDGTVNAAALQVMLDQLRNVALTLWASGTTAQRPKDPVYGQMYADSTLGKIVWCSAVRSGATAAVWTALL